MMIDDALGHSDPARLERLAAVFTAATTGATHQVVVLTCSPARYRGIGATRTVALSPSLPPPSAVPSRDGGATGDARRGRPLRDAAEAPLGVRLAPQPTRCPAPSPAP